jgi:hypothetical protein
VQGACDKFVSQGPVRACADVTDGKWKPMIVLRVARRDHPAISERLPRALGATWDASYALAALLKGRAVLVSHDLRSSARRSST